MSTGDDDNNRPPLDGEVRIDPNGNPSLRFDGDPAAGVRIDGRITGNGENVRLQLDPTDNITGTVRYSGDSLSGRAHADIIPGVTATGVLRNGDFDGGLNVDLNALLGGGLSGVRHTPGSTGYDVASTGSVTPLTPVSSPLERDVTVMPHLSDEDLAPDYIDLTENLDTYPNNASLRGSMLHPDMMQLGQRDEIRTALMEYTANSALLTRMQEVRNNPDTKDTIREALAADNNAAALRFATLDEDVTTQEEYTADLRNALKSQLRREIAFPDHWKVSDREAHLDGILNNIDSSMQNAPAGQSIQDMATQAADAAGLPISAAAESEQAYLDEMERRRERNSMFRSMTDTSSEYDMLSALSRAAAERMNQPVGDTAYAKDNAYDIAKGLFHKDIAAFGSVQEADTQAALAAALFEHEIALYEGRWTPSNPLEGITTGGSAATYWASDVVHGTYAAIGGSKEVIMDSLQGFYSGYKNGPESAPGADIWEQMKNGTLSFGEGIHKMQEIAGITGNKELQAAISTINARSVAEINKRTFDHLWMGAVYNGENTDYNKVLPTGYEMLQTSSSTDAATGADIKDRRLHPDAATNLYDRLKEVNPTVHQAIFGDRTREQVANPQKFQDTIAVADIYPYLSRATAERAYALTGTVPRNQEIRASMAATDITYYQQQNGSFSAAMQGPDGAKVSVAAVKRIAGTGVNAYNIPGDGGTPISPGHDVDAPDAPIVMAASNTPDAHTRS